MSNACLLSRPLAWFGCSRRLSIQGYHCRAPESTERSFRLFGFWRRMGNIILLAEKTFLELLNTCSRMRARKPPCDVSSPT